jgi:AcrR family transcriptional regulator
VARARSRRARPSEDRILAAAEALFAERGFGATSLRELIAASGCSTTAFYARFSDPGAVLEALFGRLVDELAAKAAAALAEARSVEHGYALGVDALVGTFRGRRGLVRVALGEGAAVPAVRERTREGYRAMAALLAEGMRDRVPDPEALAWALVGAIDLQVRRWAVLDDLDDEGLARNLHAARALLTPP